MAGGENPTGLDHEVVSPNSASDHEERVEGLRRRAKGFDIGKIDTITLNKLEWEGRVLVTNTRDVHDRPGVLLEANPGYVIWQWGKSGAKICLDSDTKEISPGENEDEWIVRSVIRDDATGESTQKTETMFIRRVAETEKAPTVTENKTPQSSQTPSAGHEWNSSSLTPRTPIKPPSWWNAIPPIEPMATWPLPEIKWKPELMRPKEK